MSISAQLQQAASDKAQQERGARIARVNDAFNDMADKLPALLKEIAAAAQLRVTPATGFTGYFKNAAANSKKLEEKRNKKLEVRFYDTGLDHIDYFMPQGLEKFSGYRRLREYCAQPQVDICLDFALHESSVYLRVKPAEPFSSSKAIHYASSTYKIHSIPEFLATNDATLAPPQIAPKISVMAPLKLKG